MHASVYVQCAQAGMGKTKCHVVTSTCVDHKYQECVAVCPVEAFRELDTYLVIDPDECICERAFLSVR